MRNNNARERKNWKLEIVDKLLKSPTKQSVESSVIVLKAGSKEMYTTIASFCYEKSISFNVADSSSFACMIAVLYSGHQFID